jgi:Tol biopolymer transport system component
MTSRWSAVASLGVALLAIAVPATATAGSADHGPGPAGAVAKAAEAQPSEVTVRLVSVSDSGQPVNAPSTAPSLSASGARVAFQSEAARLAPRDRNRVTDVFVRDLPTGTTRLVSRTGSGAAGNAASTSPALSADGRFVTFTSGATDLVTADRNGLPDVFRHDLRTGGTIRESVGGLPAGRTVGGSSVSGDGALVAFEVTAAGRTDVYIRDIPGRRTRRQSVTPTGGETDGISVDPAVSADGRFVAFRSAASDVVPGDDNGAVDVFRRTLPAGPTVLVSRDHDGGPSDGPALGGAPAIGPHGRFVIFHSEATDLVAADRNGEPDVFRRDLLLDRTELVSVTSAEEQVTGFGSFHTVSMDVGAGGRWVAFSSDFTGLTPDDVNGRPDVFLRDVRTGTTRLVSRGLAGTSPEGYSLQASTSDDGRYVAFSSDAPGVTADDRNGEVNDVFRARTR